MPKFRKKPVVIEAELFSLNKNKMPLPFSKEGVCCYADGRWYVETLEGPLNISDGDWIIKGIKGEFYPIKNDIFRETYDEVADAAQE